MNYLMLLVFICISELPFIIHSAHLVSWPLIQLRASFFLQLSPEEGCVSAKEDCFFYTAQSLEEEGPADAALFHAELALVSGPTFQRFLKPLHFVMERIVLSLFMLTFQCLLSPRYSSTIVGMDLHMIEMGVWRFCLFT